MERQRDLVENLMCTELKIHARLPVTLVQNFRDCTRDYHIAGANVRRLELSSVACLLLMLSGCCKPFDAPTKQENEAARAWVTASWRGQYDWTRIAQWKRVTESRILGAEKFLRSIAVVRMPKEEAQELVGESNVTEGNETPYLVRAVGDAEEVFPLELDVRPDGIVWVGGERTANAEWPCGGALWLLVTADA